MNDLTHISLFSGIGGFDLAAEWAGFRTIAMCEIDPFCQEVLKARFGEQALPLLVPDIRDFDGTRFRGATLLTGGFPCQPFSHAGKRRGKEDDRHLWPEMLRVIREARPAWVVAENVAGLISMELHQVLAELEGAGYEVDPYVVPACAVNAPHRRDRVWICGHARELGLPGFDGRRTREKPTNRHRPIKHAQNDPAFDGLSSRDSNGTRTDARPATGGSRDSIGESDSDAPDASGQRLSRKFRGQLRGLSGTPGTSKGGESSRGVAEASQWDIPWIEVATCLCRVDDGLPAWVHACRVARLKALGNAIVPQVAHEIIKAIAEIEGGTP